MNPALAAVTLLIFSGMALQAQDLQPQISTSSTSTFVVARASIGSPESTTELGTDAFARPVTSGTPSPVLAVIPQ
jgi:hypothetical protein